MRPTLVLATLAVCLLAAAPAAVQAAEKDRDCVASTWSSWDPCTDENGHKKTRTRFVLAPQEGNGAACPALEQTKLCAKDCVYANWGKWSNCYNRRDQTRTREVQTEAFNGGEKCTESGKKESRKCADVDCNICDKDISKYEYYSSGDCDAPGNWDSPYVTIFLDKNVNSHWSGDGKKCDCDANLKRTSYPKLENCKPSDCKFNVKVNDQCYTKQNKEYGKSRTNAYAEVELTQAPRHQGRRCTHKLLSSIAGPSLIVGKIYKGPMEKCQQGEPCRRKSKVCQDKCDGTRRFLKCKSEVALLPWGNVPQASCPPTKTESRACKVNDCKVGGWSLWSGCGKNTFSEERTRTVTTEPDPVGTKCPHLRETRTCALAETRTEFVDYDCEPNCGDLQYVPTKSKQDYM